MFLLILGCADAPSLVGACLSPESPDVFSASLEGTVLESGEGETAEECPVTVGVGGLESTSWLRLEDGDGAPWTVLLTAPFAPTWPEPGEAVTVDMSVVPGGWSPTIGELTLRDGTGRLRLWLGQGGALEDLSPPEELALEQGRREARHFSSCGRWSDWKLEAMSGGDSATLRAGESGAVGGLEVLNAAYQIQDSAGGSCLDWYVANVMVLAAAR